MGTLDLFNAANILKIRVIGYGLLIFFSFLIFVGVAVMRDKETFGLCPLYLNDYNHFGSSSNCDYPMAIAIIFQLCFLIFRVGILVLLLLGKFTTDFFLFSDIVELMYVVADLVAFFLTFIGACILSAGSNGAHANYEFNWRPASRAAQAGAWISVFLWLAIGICGFLWLWRAGKIPFLRGGANAGQPKEETAAGQQPESAPDPKV